MSKAAERSSKTKMDWHWSSIAGCMSLITLISAVSSALILPVGRLHLGIKTIVMEIFIDLRGDDSFKCLWQERKIGNRPVVTKLVGVRSFFLVIRGRTIDSLKSEAKKPLSRDKFIMVVMVGRRTSTQFFRSHVGSGSREQDLGFEKMDDFFKVVIGSTLKIC